MARADARWLSAAAMAGLLSVGACGESTTTNNYAGCGPGTTLDPGTNLCVSSPDGSAGSAGEGGTAGSSGDGGAGQDASAGSNADAGAAGTGDQDAGDAQEVGPEPDPNDDTCITGDMVVINGDKACGEYKPGGICSATESGGWVEPLTLSDLRLSDWSDPLSGGVWIRTPSHPGANPNCGSGCTSQGTVAKIVVPVHITPVSPTSYSISANHIDSEQPMAPWKVSWESVSNPGCFTASAVDCWTEYTMSTLVVNIIIETADPEAPARNFHIFAAGSCP